MIDVLVPLEQEGTKAVISRWLHAVGDQVGLYEPLVELETDKVSVEVPAPVAGKLTEILIAEGTDAAPGAILARINPEAVATAPQPAPVAEAPKTFVPERPQSEDMSHWLSPAVRKALAETGLDPTGIHGTGRGGRITRADVDKAARVKPAPVAPTPTPAPAPETSGARMIPHSGMRLAIARNMLQSVTTAPQVTAVFEADFSAIVAHRKRHKAEFAEKGVNLSYTAYLILAAAKAMRAVPEVNSRWHDTALEVFSDINIGIGTALGDEGLVVPVIRSVQDLSLFGVASRLQDLTLRARDNRLSPEDMRGGTFTISNHGVSGSLLAAPIVILQPQSAILGVGKLEKRVVVREIDGVDTIQIRPLVYVTLTIDHRVLDGHQTNKWLESFVQTLENWTD